MGLVPLQDIPMFVTAVFCISGTFMWSNLLINSKIFFFCLFDSNFKTKSRKQWILIILVFIHSIGTLACSFPNCLCAIFPEACPTPYFHCASCGGYTLGQSMAQAVLAARLIFFQLTSKSALLPIIGIGLVGARLVTGIYQCSVSDYIQLPGWGYWVPIQSPKVLSAVYSLDFVNNFIFTSLFSLELFRHYKAMEKHSNQSTLYKMRNVLQNAAVGGVLAGIGTVILAALIISEAAKNEMQIVVIFAEITWNSVIVTHMVNGVHEENAGNPDQATSEMSPKKKDVEMSLLTTASVFSARLEAPEPIDKRKSPDELRSFKYDHGMQNSPISSKDDLHGMQRVEEEFRFQLGSSASGEKSGLSATGEKSLGEKSSKEEDILESPRDRNNSKNTNNSREQPLDADAMEVL